MTVTDEDLIAAGEAKDKQTQVSTSIYDGTSNKNGSVRFWTRANGGKIVRDGADVAYSVIGSGDAVTPAVNDIFYLKEVPNCYLKFTGKYVYDTAKNNEVVKFFLLTGVDDSFFNQIGFNVVTKDYSASLAAKFSYQRRNDDTVTTITVADVTADGQVGYIAVLKPVVEGSTDDLILQSLKTSDVSMYPYWITPDGVTVVAKGITIAKTDKLVSGFATTEYDPKAAASEP